MVFADHTAVWVAFFTMIGTIIGTFATVVMAYFSLKAKLAEIQKMTNGMKTELVNEVRKSSFAAGAKSETDKHPGEKP